MFDGRQLRAQMALKGVSVSDLAAVLCLNESTVYRKIKNDGNFTRREILAICETLDVEDPSFIFFADDITETQDTGQ